MSHANDGHRPLVWFTSLAIAGAGAVAAGTSGLYGAPASRLALIAGLVLLAAGLAVSVGHLGRPERATRAARGLRRSPISLEGALGGATLALGATAWFGVLPAASAWITLSACVAACLFLASVGLVYRLGGQLTWTGFSATTPVTAGLAFGAVFVNSLPPEGAAVTATLVVLAIDAVVFSRRWRQVLQVAIEHAGHLGPGFDRRHELLVGRFFLLDVVPAIILLVHPTPVAAAVAGLGLVVDRLGFYALAFQHRTEAEIGRVEHLMDGR
jgi:DMSO reductase anchor subunit